jgi:integrase
MIQVTKSLGLPRDSPYFENSLPPGFSFLVDSSTESIIEPALFWLTSNFPFRGKRWSAASVENAAFDLRLWWTSLERMGKAWDEVTPTELEEFRDELMTTVSVRTQQLYGPGIVRRTIGSVASMYKWAAAQGLYSGPPMDKREIRNGYRRADTDFLAGIAPSRRKPSLVILKGTPPLPNRVHPLQPHEWTKIFRALGPLPSEQEESVFVPSRNRLTAETSLWSAARVDEVAHISKYQIASLEPDEVDDDVSMVIHLTHTKGLIPRNAKIPAHLVRELKTYIKGERAEAVEKGRSYGLAHEPKALFVNGVDAGRDAGRGVTRWTLWRTFHLAVLEAGLTREVTKVELASGNQFDELVAAHCFHDLRHTFACWHYQAEVESGNPEPWKSVQARLGHQKLSTTVDLYLKVVDLFRRKVNTTFYHFLRSTIGQ